MLELSRKQRGFSLFAENGDGSGEAARRDKGVVRDAKIHAAVCAKIEALVAACGWRRIGLIASPIEGGDGNREFLIAAERP